MINLDVSDTEASERDAPSRAQILVPVWGDEYVSQFLTYSLPSLLSSGNVPAIAKKIPSRFVFLTSERDESAIRSSQAFGRLSQHVEVMVRHIDHLISSGNHTTAITLAFAEAISESGKLALETCHFLLVSDYIMADGSLSNVLARMECGASAVLAGNFQTSAELALPSIGELYKSTSVDSQPGSRELVRFAMRYLHPATIANTVNYPINHNAHTNRIFWRIDDTALLGRFYLLHPVCIRPLRYSFSVGSSLDYSFVPELCRPGRVEVIEDSDEYFVIEVQPRSHETGNLRMGPLTPDGLSRSLAEWTTAEHRWNIQHKIIFHSGAVPADVDKILRESEDFIGLVSGRLSSEPQPYRGHHYWQGAVAAFTEQHGKRALRRLPFVHIPRQPASLQWKLRHFLHRSAPRCRVWDEQWPHFKPLNDEIEAALSRSDHLILHVAHGPTACGVWLSDEKIYEGKSVVHRSLDWVIQESLGNLGCDGLDFDLCIIESTSNDARILETLVDRISPVLRHQGRIVISTEFVHEMAGALSALSCRPNFVVTSEFFISESKTQRAVRAARQRVYHAFRLFPWLGLAVGVFAVPALLIVAALANWRAFRRSHQPTTNSTKYILFLDKVSEPDSSASGSSRNGFDVASFPLR